MSEPVCSRNLIAALDTSQRERLAADIIMEKVRRAGLAQAQRLEREAMALVDQRMAEGESRSEAIAGVTIVYEDDLPPRAARVEEFPVPAPEPTDTGRWSRVDDESGETWWTIVGQQGPCLTHDLDGSWSLDDEYSTTVTAEDIDALARIIRSNT